MVYFIQDTSSGAIKIGISRNPAARLSALQTAHHSELRLLGIMDGMEQEERMLHQQFRCIRGEWFSPSQELLTFISERSVSLALLDYPVEADQPIEVTHIIHWPMISLRAYSAIVILWGILSMWSIVFWIIPNILAWMSLGDRILLSLISVLTVPLGALHFVTRRWRPIQVTRFVSGPNEPSPEMQLRKARREIRANKINFMLSVLLIAIAISGLIYGFWTNDIAHAGKMAGAMLVATLMLYASRKKWLEYEAKARALIPQSPPR